MTQSGVPTSIFCATLICAGLVTANSVLAEECYPSTSMQQGDAHKQTALSDIETQSKVRISARQQALFQNPALNESDGLSDYGEDFHTAYLQ